MSEKESKASWGLRLAAIVATLLAVVVVFAVKFGNHGNEMRAAFSAGMPIAGGLLAAFLFGLIKKLATPHLRWSAYLYVLVAIVLYLVVVEFI